jgi:hypothetical protein
MQSVIRYRESIDTCIDNLEIIKNHKMVTIADELKVVNQMNIDQLDDKVLTDDIERVMKEFKSDYFPKLIMKNEGKYIII